MKENLIAAPARIRSIGGHRQATAAEQKQMLDDYIAEGQARAAGVIERIFTKIPEDRLVRSSAVRFETADAGPGLVLAVPKPGSDIEIDRLPMHDNAFAQACARVEAPEAFMRGLAAMPGWGTDLAARNLNDLMAYRVGPQPRFLVRAIDGQARGFLSDHYRRLDSRPIIETLLGAVQKAGAVIADGVISDVRVSIRAILPQVYEPVAGEVMAFGLAFANSDFGRGAVELSAFALRVWCTNAATLENVLRKVHLGGRLDENLAFSQRTYDLDTKTIASAVQDMAAGMLDPARIDALNGRVAAAAAQEIDPARALVALRRTMTKGETDAVAAAFNGPDVEMLPAGNTAWRFSNALSWVARHTEDQTRRMEIEAMAGDVIAAKAA